MTPDTAMSVFGWMTLLNFGLLIFATVTLYATGDWAARIHGRITKLNHDDLYRAYFSWLGQYKMFTILLCLAPYIAMRIVL